MHRSFFLIALVLCVACQTETTSVSQTETSSTTATQAQAAPPQQEIRYTAISQSVFLPTATIDGWINASPPNDTAIADHAWDLWLAMNAPSGQSYNGTELPVWETWYDSTTVYKVNEGAAPTADAAQGGDMVMAKAQNRRVNPQRRMHRPNQFFKGHSDSQPKATPAPVTGNAGLLLTFNRFTEEMKDHVWTNSYYLKQTLTDLNNSWTATTPVAQRVIKPFPNTSIMTKPVFWIISGSQPTMVPYWNGLS